MEEPGSSSDDIKARPVSVGCCGSHCISNLGDGVLFLVRSLFVRRVLLLPLRVCARRLKTHFVLARMHRSHCWPVLCDCSGVETTQANFFARQRSQEALRDSCIGGSWGSMIVGRVW
jgi:hypothetical protein